MTKPKGGRGKAAPYDTRQVRVPEPIISQCHELIERYQSYIADGGQPLEPPRFLDVGHKAVNNFTQAQEVEQLKAQIAQLEESHKLVDKYRQRVEELTKELVEVKNERDQLKPVDNFNRLETSNQQLLTQAELAKRLGCDQGTLTKNRGKTNFGEWSRDKDPDQKAWKYLPDIKRFALVQGD